ncbi:MAG TPA: LacI family DNA-binding transcriptional regulator [Clostridia bacterium]|nr:LacI family DNA-binding transcriptional regulator [Clostridia bacterium]
MEKPRLTIKDIASACNVSIATVSYVLNDRAEERISEQTRKKILHYVNLHGYETSLVAKALATGHNHTAGVFAPRACGAPDRARGTLLFIRALTQALETRGMRTLLLSEQCLRQRSAHVDAIVAVDLPRAEFYAIGEQNFCPLICVDGCMDDLMLFYQVYDDFFALASRARELAGGQRLFFLHDAYADEGISRRVREAFDAACASNDPALAQRARGDDFSAFVAMGTANWQALRALGRDSILVLYEGECAPQGAESRTIRLSSGKKGETVAQLVVDTVARKSGSEHDIRIFQ